MAERLTQAEVELIETHYATKGAQWCADQLGRKVPSIYFAARSRGIRGTPGRFASGSYNPHYRPPAKVAHQMVTGRTLHELARDHLAKNTAVYRCTERGHADLKGTFWRIGNIVVSDDELLRRARAKGFGL